MAETTSIRKTPLYSVHQSLGARMMPFAGFDMPVQYSGIVDEHMAVRQAAGLFDVSHMGEFLISGPQATELVQWVVTNDVQKLYDGRAMYTVMCNQAGGILDDLLVYRISENQYLLVVNAANVASDFAWIQAHNRFEATVEDLSDDLALLALQGPASFAIAQKLTATPIGDLKYYHFTSVSDGVFSDCRFSVLSHTGYTGESGLEIYVDAEKAVEIWNNLMEVGRPYGLKPAGLGARDTLRLEAGFALYGSDLSEETSPFDAGLGWVVKLDKGHFVASEVLKQIKERGPERRLVGFILEERGVPRHGYPILDFEKGDQIGVVTSGTQSPLLARGIGMGYVRNEPDYTHEGVELSIRIRGRAIKATVRKPPFHK